MKDYKDFKITKYDSAIGSFWGASVFIGLLITIVIGFNGNMKTDWIKAILIGGSSFLILGLITQGIITLIKK